MQVLRLISVIILLFLSSCSYFEFTKDNSAPPKPIKPIASNDQEQVKTFKTLWSTKTGVGDASQYLKLKSYINTPYVYTVDAKGLVESRDLVSGRLLWQSPLKTNISAGVSGGPDAIYVSDDKGKLYALGVQDGAILWTHDFKQPILNNSVYSLGKVYTQTAEGFLYALNAKTGKFSWSYKSNMPELSLYGSAKPVTWRDLVIAGFANGRLVALNSNTGSIAWEKSIAYSQGRSSLQRMVDINSSPLVYKDILYAVSYQGNLVAIDLDTGAKLWQKPLSSNVDMAILKNNLYVTKSDGSITALDRRDGKTLWNNNDLLARSVSAPEAIESISGPNIVVGDYAGYLHLLDGNTGKIIGRTHIGKSGVRVAPNTYSGIVYALSNEGNFSAMQVS
tara:strand:- start:4260 stop:5435 length:1176 start_codon:yes stop_codon:yes gene_type:complete